MKDLNKQTASKIQRLIVTFSAEWEKAVTTRDKNRLDIDTLEAENDQLNARIWHLRGVIEELELLLPIPPSTHTDAGESLSDYDSRAHTIESRYPVYGKTP